MKPLTITQVAKLVVVSDGTDLSKTKQYKEAVKNAKEAGRKPPVRWRVMWYDNTGDQKSQSFATKPLAESHRSEIERTLLDGTYVDPATARVQFGDVADKCLDARHDLRPSTWWKYRGLLDNHVLPQWGELPLNKILKEDIEVWVAILLMSKDDGGSGLGPSQARHAYRVLSMVLEWCVPARLPRNPARGVKVPVLPEYEHIYLHYGQVEALAEASGTLITKYKQPTACAPVNPVFMRLLAYTGIRWGEAAALRIGRVNLAQRRIRIAGTFYELGGVQHEGLPKNGNPALSPSPTFCAPSWQRSSPAVANANCCSSLAAVNRCEPTTGAPASSTPPSPPPDSTSPASLHTSSATPPPHSRSRPAPMSRSSKPCSATRTRP